MVGSGSMGEGEGGVLGDWSESGLHRVWLVEGYATARRDFAG